MLALEKHNEPYLFLLKQATWAALGLLLVPIVMRIDYRNYRQPGFIWAGVGWSSASPSSRCCSAGP